MEQRTTDRGTHSSITCKTKEEYDRLKPLGRKERFIEHQKYKSAV